MTVHEVMLLKTKGGYMWTPEKYPTFDYHHR